MLYGCAGEGRTVFLKKRTVSTIMLTLLLTSMLTLAFNVQPVKAEPKTWYVDDDGGADFTKIQDAINAAGPGDTILVAVGTYNENITVSKSISLIGENTSTTIIDGGGADTVVYITADYVKFIGFTVQNGVYNGIHLHYSQYSNISHNTIKSVFFNGILIDNSHQNHLIDNNITSIFYIGIYLELRSK
jgi:parallel beta-helix repeat protein